MKSTTPQQGFTLLELMIALTVGVMLIGGTVSMIRNSSGALKRNETNAEMVSAIRQASKNIQSGIQMAGYFGRTRYPGDVLGRKNDTSPLPNLSGDCEAGFYIDIQVPIYVIDDAEFNPFSSTCMSASEHKADTDILVVRHAIDKGTTLATLDANKLYVLGNPTGGQLFIGNSPPSIGAFPYAGNFRPEIGKKIYEVVTHIYYVKDTAGTQNDGLYRLELSSVSGTPYTEQRITTDIVNLQIQLGTETCDPSAGFGPNICVGRVDNYQTGSFLTNTSASTSIYSRASTIRTVSVAFTALSSQVKGVDSLSKVTYSLRDEDVEESSASVFQASTYQIRNSENVFR